MITVLSRYDLLKKQLKNSYEPIAIWLKTVSLLAFPFSGTRSGATFGKYFLRDASSLGIPSLSGFSAYSSPSWQEVYMLDNKI